MGEVINRHARLGILNFVVLIEFQHLLIKYLKP